MEVRYRQGQGKEKLLGRFNEKRTEFKTKVKGGYMVVTGDNLAVNLEPKKSVKMTVLESQKARIIYEL